MDEGICLESLGNNEFSLAPCFSAGFWGLDVLRTDQKNREFGSPRLPRGGEGLGVRGRCTQWPFRHEGRRCLLDAERYAVDHRKAVPLTLQPLSRVGARGAEFFVEFQFFHSSPESVKELMN